MLSDLDSDGNGTIDFAEWVTLMTKRVSDKDTRANIDKVFAMFDADKNGCISTQTLERVAAELGETVSK